MLLLLFMSTVFYIFLELIVWLHNFYLVPVRCHCKVFVLFQFCATVLVDAAVFLYCFKHFICKRRLILVDLMLCRLLLFATNLPWVLMIFRWASRYPHQWQRCPGNTGCHRQQRQDVQSGVLGRCGRVAYGQRLVCQSPRAEKSIQDNCGVGFWY